MFQEFCTTWLLGAGALYRKRSELNELTSHSYNQEVQHTFTSTRDFIAAYSAVVISLAAIIIVPRSIPSFERAATPQTNTIPKHELADRDSQLHSDKAKPYLLAAGQRGISIRHSLSFDKIRDNLLLKEVTRSELSKAINTLKDSSPGLHGTGIRKIN
uniref:Uncharacterized protein n=1 Tax=Glossina pallidipes TaxID=7398 RepID=A0A1B0A0K6_GLOPL